MDGAHEPAPAAGVNDQRPRPRPPPPPSWELHGRTWLTYDAHVHSPAVGMNDLRSRCVATHTHTSPLSPPQCAQNHRMLYIAFPAHLTSTMSCEHMNEQQGRYMMHSERINAQQEGNMMNFERDT